MKEDRWRMIGEDTRTAVRGVEIVEGGSDNMGVRESIKKIYIFSDTCQIFLNTLPLPR